MAKKNCPTGCPCDGYECSTELTTLLVVTDWGENGPLLTDVNGREDYDISFTTGDEYVVS